MQPVGVRRANDVPGGFTTDHVFDEILFLLRLDFYFALIHKDQARGGQHYPSFTNRIATEFIQ